MEASSYVFLLMSNSNQELLKSCLVSFKNRNSWKAHWKRSCKFARRAHCKEMRQSQELIHHTSIKSLARIEHDMKQGSDEPEKILTVDVWLRAYQPKRKEVESISISSKHVRSSKGKKKEKKKKVEKNDKEAKLAPHQMQQVHLLSWYGVKEDIVATGQLVSKDPTEKVHRVPLGPCCWKVWVHEVFEDIVLRRPTSEFTTLSTAKGTTVAWPIKDIKLL